MLKVDEGEKYAWQLYCSCDDYILVVLCGSIGLYEVKIRLSEAELAAYEALGANALDDLAYDIARNDQAFRARWLP